MRLLNIETLKLKEFVGEEVPRYAILSHTWGQDEVLFKHICYNGYRGSSTKINGTCSIARNHGLEWAWIDTCCIDKSSSAELSEAINSMFAWYQRADVCVVFLEDVKPDEKSGYLDASSTFYTSRWFTRGWTLQELLAPHHLESYDGHWNKIHRISKLDKEFKRCINSCCWGYEIPLDNESFLQALILATNIHREVIAFVYNDVARKYSAAQKMSWASGRKTTRNEDRAYSLLGLFDVNMPLIYGEGKKAFARLQEEIMKTDDDQSIFAWGYEEVIPSHGGLLAISPSCFSGCRYVSRQRKGNEPHHFLTNKGLRIETLFTAKMPDFGPLSFALINCADSRRKDNRLSRVLGIPLYRLANGNFRPPGAAPIALPKAMFQETPEKIYIDTIDSLEKYKPGAEDSAFLLEHLLRPLAVGFEMRYGLPSMACWEVYPPNWSPICHVPVPPPITSQHMMEVIRDEEQMKATEDNPCKDTIWIRFRADEGLLHVPDVALKLNIEWYERRQLFIWGCSSLEAKPFECSIAAIPKHISLFENIAQKQDTWWSSEIMWEDMLLKSKFEPSVPGSPKLIHRLTGDETRQKEAHIQLVMEKL